LARLQTRTLDARILSEGAAIGRGLSSTSLSRQAKTHLAEALSSASLSSSSLSSSARLKPPAG